MIVEMPRLFRLAYLSAALAVSSWAADSAPNAAKAPATPPDPAAVAKTFTAPALFEHEVVGFMNVLENYHYNRDNVRPADFNQLVPDYMAEFDSQRLFFLETDREEFVKKFPANWLYNNITTLGRVDPAFAIFSRFKERADARIAWVVEQLKRPIYTGEGEKPADAIDLMADDTYTFDRTKSPWPKDQAEADALWQARLKFDLVAEIINKKAPETARTDLAKRYERMLKSTAETEAIELCEIYLSTVARLYDPHSTYFSPDTFADFKINMGLQLVGIGAVLGMEDDLCTVKEIVTAGPADLSKQIQPNDKILSVAQGENGEPVEIVGMKLRKIVELIRGSKGTKVRLLIQEGKDASRRKEIVIVRDVVNLNSARARGAIYDVPRGDGQGTRPIGVITLPTFYSADPSAEGDEKASATGDVAKLIDQMKTAGVEGMVLDLRQNGGGYLHEAVSLVGLFINKGPVVQVRNYYGNVDVDNDEDGSVAYDGPLTVLVSRFSASASEIAAGALQNYGRAVIVGDSSTHGKGTVQQVIDMKSAGSPMAKLTGKAGAVKFTVQKFYLPDGHSTQLKGVVPDVTLPSIDDYLPIGERDLPRALIWDEIPSSKFAGRPVSSTLAQELRTRSEVRQKALPEFDLLRKNIDWFKVKQEQKSVTLNIGERRRQKDEDSAFRKTMNAERATLAAGNYPMREFLLGPKTPPNAKVKSEDDEDDEPDDETKRVDVHLRESLRVVNDTLDIIQKNNSLAGLLTLNTFKRSPETVTR